MNKEEIKQLLTKYFKDRKKIRAAYVYGSVVTGRDSLDSDVDIALLTVPYKDKLESSRARICYQTEISRLVRRDVDIAFLQEAGELLSFQIMSRGQVVFETDKETHRSFRAYRLIKCLDFQFLEDRMKRGMVTAMKEDIIG